MSEMISVDDVVKKWGEGLPAPLNQASAFTMSKRQSLEGVLNVALGAEPLPFMIAAIAAANELPPTAKRGDVARAIFNAATLGLTFGNIRGEAYLLPFRNKRESERTGQDVHEVSLVIGYKGFRNLAFMSGFLKSFTTDVVLAGEVFEVWNDERGRHFKHVPEYGRKIPNNADGVVAAWCQYETRTGGLGVVVVEREELLGLAKGDIWKSRFPAMAQKTAIRRAAREWHVAGKLADAVHLDEQADRGELQTLLFNSGLLEDNATAPARKMRTGQSRLDERLSDIRIGKTKVCPHCNSERVVQFNADLDQCSDCKQTFGGT